MKKIVISTLLILFAAISSYATQVTITGTVFNNWKYGGSTAKLRIFANDKFLTNTGEVIIPGAITGGGTWYREVSCTVASSTITCPSYILDSTTNSSVPTATYTGVFYDYKNIRRDYLFQRWKVPHDSGSSISFNSFLMYQSAIVASLPATYYTSGQVDLLFGGFYTKLETDSLISTLTAGQLSQVEHLIDDGLATIDLSSKAETTDSRFVKDISSYGSLSSAISSIGSTVTTLNVTSSVTVSSTVSIPNNICLNVTDDGALAINSGVTLTIGCLENTGNKKIFSSSGTGKVLFTKNAVNEIKLSWWTGPTSGQNITDAMTEALESANAYQMPIHIGQGTWYTTGNHTILEGVTIKGEGNHLLSNLGTVIQLQSPTSDNLFIIGEINYSVRFENIILTGAGTTSKAAVVFRGTYPDSSGDVSFDKVTFQEFAKGIWHNDVEVGPNVDWQMAQVNIDHCIFVNNTVSIQTESLNSAFTISSTNFYIGDNQTAILTHGIGITTITGCEFAGITGGSVVGRKVLVINGAHVQINMIGNQDEGNNVFLENNASDITGIVNLHGNLIQSILNINYSMTLNSVGNNYMPDAIRIVPPASPNIFSQNDNIRVDVGTIEAPSTIPANPLRLVKDTNPITQYEFNPTLASGSGGLADGGMKVRHFSKFVTPYYLSGSESTPVLQILDSSNGGGETQKLLRIGRATADQVPEYYYDFYRSNSGTDAGRLIIQGNQTGFFGIDMKQDLKVDGAVRQQACAMSDTGTAIAFDPKCGNYFYITLSGNRNLTPAALSSDEQNRSDGQEITLAITQDATGGRTLTPSTGTGQILFGTTITSLNFSTTANKTNIVKLQYDKRLNKWLVVNSLAGF